MELIESFRSFITQQQLFRPGQRLLVAVSGGLDSAVLCALCHECGLVFEMAHCHFGLRGKESERDKEFVERMGTKYGVKVWVKDFDTLRYVEDNKVSVQEAARELRYEWFASLLDEAENKLDVLLTAHHADDSVETSVMNYFKGTGIAGLRGILPKQGRIVRPLLFASRKELLSYAMERSVQWVEDSSNESDKYTRNYFRHRVIPLIQQIYPDAENNMRDNLARLRETEQLYRQAVQLHKKKLLVKKGEEIHVPVLKLQQVTPLRTVLYEIIKEYGFSAGQTVEVMALLDSGPGKYVQSATHRIIRNRAWLIITPVKAEASSLIVIDGPGEYDFAEGRIKVEAYFSKDGKPGANAAVAELDASAISFPLILRPWKTGDYFYPLGMQKKKKLARFFIDQKMSMTEKERAWVVEMDKKIVWVVGKRIDDRFRMRAAPPGTAGAGVKCMRLRFDGR